MLEKRLAGARERRREANVATDHVCLNEATWAPWDRHYYGHLSAAVRAVADKSAYTAIVALRLWLREGPNLVLNSDYASTRVPVPEGLVGRRIVVEK